MARFFRNQRHKYNAKAVIVDGIRFPSMAEGAWYGVIKTELRAGTLRSARRQVRYQLGDIGTIVDYEVITAAGEKLVYEVKGNETDRFRLIRRLWPKYAPCPMVVVRGRRRRNGRWKWTFEPPLRGKP